MITMNKIILLLILIFANTFFLEAKEVATITALKGDVNIKSPHVFIKATLGTKLQEEDTVITKEKSKVQIIFTDETVVTIGKNSTFVIKKYLAEGNNMQAELDLMQGAMRTITGKIGKVAPKKFKVRTKTATIGIRGTNFTVIAYADNSCEAYCTYGEIYIIADRREYTVPYGYHILINSQMQARIEPFTAKDLKNLSKEFFQIHKKTNGENEKRNRAIIPPKMGENIQILSHSNEKETLAKTIQKEQTLVDNFQNEDISSLTDSMVIDSYSMSEAIYGGRYATSFSTGSLYPNGDALLKVDFGHDSAELGLGDYYDRDAIVWYDFKNVNSNTISGTQRDGGDGTAQAQFYGETGNIVKGKFSFKENGRITAKGTFSVGSGQTLH